MPFRQLICAVVERRVCDYEGSQEPGKKRPFPLSCTGTNGQVTYGGIAGDDFTIDPHTGLISTLGPLDHEERAEHLLTGNGRLGGRPGGGWRGGGGGGVLFAGSFSISRLPPLLATDVL